MSTMTGKEYSATIAGLGLTQVAAAAFLGASPRVGRTWAKDGPDKESVAKLLRLMRHHNLTPDEVDVINASYGKNRSQVRKPRRNAGDLHGSE